MGFFRDRSFENVRAQARANGLRESDGVKECQDCYYSASVSSNRKCITGLVCTGRTFSNGEYMCIPASWVCDEFQWK